MPSVAALEIPYFISALKQLQKAPAQCCVKLLVGKQHANKLQATYNMTQQQQQLLNICMARDRARAELEI